MICDNPECAYHAEMPPVSATLFTVPVVMFEDGKATSTLVSRHPHDHEGHRFWFCHDCYNEQTVKKVIYGE